MAMDWLRGLVRRSAALKMLPLAGVLVWTAGLSQVADRFYWAGAAANLNSVAAMICGPIAAGVAAWSFATRRPLAVQMAGFPRGVQFVLRQAMAPALIVSLPWLALVAFVGAGFETVPVVRFSSLVLVGFASVVAWSAVGLAFGALFKRAAAAAAAVLVSYLWIGWGATTNNSLRHLSFQMVTSPAVYEQVPGAVTRSLWLMVLGMVAVGVGAALYRWHWGASVVGVAIAGVALLGAIGTIRGVGVFPTEARTAGDAREVVCTTVEATRVCVWEENRSGLERVTPALAKVLRALRDTGYGAPAVLTAPNIPLAMVGVEAPDGRVDAHLTFGSTNDFGQGIGEAVLPAMPACGTHHSPLYPGRPSYGFPGLEVRNLMVNWLALHAWPVDEIVEGADPGMVAQLRRLSEASPERQRAWFDANVRAQVDCSQQPVPLEQVP